MTKCEFDPPMMFLYTLEMDKGRQAKRASFFSMLSNGWALLFGLVLLNNKSQENVPPRSEHYVCRPQSSVMMMMTIIPTY